jgi:hypothetical protein
MGVCASRPKVIELVRMDAVAGALVAGRVCLNIQREREREKRGLGVLPPQIKKEQETLAFSSQPQTRPLPSLKSNHRTCRAK